MKPKSHIAITYLTTSFPRFDGDFAGSFILKYVCELERLGARIDIVAPDTKDARPLSLPPQINLIRFKYFYPGSAQKIAYGAGIPNRLKQNPGALFQLPFLLIAFFITALRSARKSELLHAFWSPAGIISVIVGFMKSKPVVITLWGSDLFFLKMPILSHLFRVILNKADALIFENQHFKKQVEKLNFSNENIMVIPNGVDLRQFKHGDKVAARAALKLPTDGLIILSVGSLTKAKGHIYLLQALSDLLGKRDDIHLHIVGEGDEHDFLKKEIARLGLDKKVDLAGRVTHDTIVTWLSAADIFALPSLHEGTPNSLLEAMAMGLPVIASATGGIPEVIDDGISGLLVTPASTKELKEKLSQLVESTDLCDRLGKNARLKIETNFGSWEDQAGKLHSLYQKLLRDNPTAP